MCGFIKPPNGCNVTLAKAKKKILDSGLKEEAMFTCSYPNPRHQCSKAPIPTEARGKSLLYM